MFLYFGKHFTQSAAGQRLARVECDRCGTGYCYQLSRVGTGVGVAPYCLGQARAARLAEQRAAKELERALDRGRELVPCPKCSWINEDLVQGYRRTRYRLWGRVAFYILGTAILLALTLVPLLAFGDPDALPIVALILLGIVLLSGGTLGIQMWLRGRINPNRNYPDAPELLPGTPPALLQDPISGEIKAASNGRIGVAPVGEWCDFQLGRHQLPPVCCVCLNEASEGHAAPSISSGRADVRPALRGMRRHSAARLLANLLDGRLGLHLPVGSDRPAPQLRGRRFLDRHGRRARSVDAGRRHRCFSVNDSRDDCPRRHNSECHQVAFSQPGLHAARRRANALPGIRGTACRDRSGRTGATRATIEAAVENRSRA